ncbi:MAG TPA: hypothetical protein VNM48_18430 [Chloroflexota bacterium]|nr:hypothetical protein [Chloroflexota bacterium]
MHPPELGAQMLPRYSLFWPRRVLVVGGDSVVSRALLVYLRKEGIDAAIVSEDVASWTSELSGRPHAHPYAWNGQVLGAHDATGISPAIQADVVILSPLVTGQRRRDLCRTLRAHAGFGAVPLIALRDAGDEPITIGALESVDVSLAWPFRLREVLSTVDSPIRGGPHAASA